METFLQFITRKSGFGKTPWPQFILIMLCVAWLFALGITLDPDGTGAKGLAYGFGVALVAVLVYGTWRNWRGKQA